MNDSEIYNLAMTFRKAIETAKEDKCFINEMVFKRFPHGCCGDACYLLAEYLRKYGVDTIWYSAQRNGWSHVWLIVKDARVKGATPSSFTWPMELQGVLASYGVEDPCATVVTTRYEKEDLQYGLIIDITADQFNDFDTPVYVGYQNGFHGTFEFNQAHDYDGLCNDRLYMLYRMVEKYL